MLDAQPAGLVIRPQNRLRGSSTVRTSIYGLMACIYVDIEIQYFNAITVMFQRYVLYACTDFTI